MKNFENKNIHLKFIFLSLSGGLLGFLFYLILIQANDKHLSIFNINYLTLFLFLIFFSISYCGLFILICLLFKKIFKENIIEEINKNFKIFIIPISLIIVLPGYFLIYEKLKSISFKVVGYVYMPFSGFFHFLFPGYFLIMIFGFYFITIAFLVFLRMIKKEYEKIKMEENIKKERIKSYFLFLFIFYIFTTTYITIIYPPTGDEPHYLIIAKSLLYDRDVNLENNYKDEKFYKDFYPVFLEYENIHNTPDKNKKGIYSIHLPGLSFLISVPYFLGKRIGVQIFINFFTAILVILFFIFLVENGIKQNKAFIISIWFGLSTPILINSSLVLTEIISAVIVLYSLKKLLKFNLNENFYLFFLGLSFLPWLHAKLSLFSILFYFYYYFLLFKHKKIFLIKEIINNFIVIISAIIYLFYFYKIYGSFAGKALVNIYQSDSFYFIFNIKHFLKSFLATLFDRDYGLFIYNPVYIFFIAGIIIAITKRKNLLPLFFILPYYILFLFWKDWGGSMTPARQLIPIIPVFGYYIADFLQKYDYNHNKIFKIFFYISFFISYILMIIPAIRYLSGKEKIYLILEKTDFKILLWFFPSFYGNIKYAIFISTIYFAIIIFSFFKIIKKEEKYV